MGLPATSIDSLSTRSPRGTFDGGFMEPFSLFVKRGDSIPALSIGGSVLAGGMTAGMDLAIYWNSRLGCLVVEAV